MKKIISLIIVLLLILLLIPACSKESKEDELLACLSIITDDDSFDLEIARAFKDTLTPLGYQTQIVFCDNNFETQRIQIENFIENHADLITVHCVGNGSIYEDLFKKAKESGSLVITMANETLINVDVQSTKYSFFKGLAKSEIVKRFLDEQYPDAAPKSVDMLVLENLTKDGLIKTCAGIRIIGEKYLRYFDYGALDYIRNRSAQTVYYLDEKGAEVQVNEPTGGLILDNDGYAQLNPFYDDRINLVLATNKNIQTVLDGQKAIDSYIVTPNGPNIKIVASFSGDAAVGANQRLMYYYANGYLENDIKKIAVFGSDDTETNRNLLLKSAKDESMYRGFVGYRSVYWEISTMLEMALDDNEDNILELDVVIGKLNKAKDSVVLEYKNYDIINDYEIFANWE